MEEIMNTTTETAVRELDRRTGDGIEVRLLWYPHTDRVVVAVEDTRRSETFAFEVDGAHALEAFRHPFAFASTHNINQALAA
jgi:hypothetical protein